MKKEPETAEGSHSPALWVFQGQTPGAQRARLSAWPCLHCVPLSSGEWARRPWMTLVAPMTQMLQFFHVKNQLQPDSFQSLSSDDPLRQWGFPQDPWKIAKCIRLLSQWQTWENFGIANMQFWTSGNIKLTAISGSSVTFPSLGRPRGRESSSRKREWSSPKLPCYEAGRQSFREGKAFWPFRMSLWKV